LDLFFKDRLFLKNRKNMEFPKRIKEYKEMGGYGSGRHNWNKKNQVEDCYQLHIKKIWRYFHAGVMNTLNWYRGERQIGSIAYLVVGSPPSSIRLIYSITSRGGERQDMDYPVNLTTTLAPWGALRWWFICPAVGCARRVAVLYLPPGSKYFACRHCYNLTYRSCQEQHQFDSVYRNLAGSMQADFPGFTPADLRYLFETDDLHKGKPPHGGYYEQRYFALLEKLKEDANIDPWSHWLHPAELCDQSGLTLSQLNCSHSESHRGMVVYCQRYHTTMRLCDERCTFDIGKLATGCEGSTGAHVQRINASRT
jgi:hypothetical protein